MSNTTLHKIHRSLRAFLACSFCVFILFGCESTPKKPGEATYTGGGLSALSEVQSTEYRQALDNLNDKKPQAAEKSLTKLLKTHKTIGELWLNLALSQYQQEKYSEASDSVRQLLALSSNIAEAHNLAGLLAVRQGEFKNATSHYEKAIALKENYANALYNMALLQDVYLQDVKSAIAFYEQYAAINTEDQQTKDWIEQLRASL